MPRFPTFVDSAILGEKIETDTVAVSLVVANVVWLVTPSLVNCLWADSLTSGFELLWHFVLEIRAQMSRMDRLVECSVYCGIQSGEPHCCSLQSLDALGQGLLEHKLKKRKSIVQDWTHDQEGILE